MARLRLNPGIVFLGIIVLVVLATAVRVGISGGDMAAVPSAAMGILVPVGLVGVILMGIWTFFAD